MRILVVVALLVVVVAGCGGSAPTHTSSSRGVPRALAHRWEAQAAQIAAAASSGDDCGAMRLANALRDQVVASERKMPLRLRSPLVTGVNALADRITCTVTTVETVPQKPPKHPPPPHGHGDHGPPGHHKHGGGGNDQ